MDGGENLKKVVISGVVSLITLGLGYLGGVGYYAEKFTPNTSYGSVNIGNLTLAEAEKQINEAINKETITLSEKGKELGKITLGDLGVEVAPDEILKATYESQDPSQWVVNLFDGTEVKNVLGHNVTVDSEQVKGALDKLNITNDDREKAVDAGIDYSDDKGYFVEPGQKGTEIDYDKLSAAIVDSLEQDTGKIELESVYADPNIGEDSEQVTKTMDYINRILDTKITLQVAGDDITIPREELQKWIHFDANNDLYVDEEMVYAYVNALNDKYSTEGKDRQFESTLQGTVTVPAGILGWSIDVDTEVQQIIADIHNGQDVTRKMAFYGVGNRLGEKDDIGNTYVEIDLTNQMMYYYVDGEVLVATNIVSGKYGTETIPGANAVIEMLYDTNLVGYNPTLKVDYKVPVDYWIRFDYQAQGIHDASWQWSFGGDTYVNNGSLGCINTPLDQVAIIYANITYGTPVLVFH